MRFILALCTTLCFFGASAQESLESLFLERALFDHSQLYKSSSDDSGIIYLLDTLEMPFVDDFSQNHMKNVHLTTDDNAVFDSSQVSFRVNGLAPDTLKLRTDTSYYFTSAAMGGLDSFPNQALEIVFYDSASYTPRDTIYLFPSYEDYFLTSDTSRVLLDPDTTLYNERISCYYARPDNSASLWINEGGFLNNSFGVNPPTIGVLTLDGLDRLGKPYDFSFPGTYGEADRITSKPLNLGKKFNGQPFTENDSIILSFYYQPQGVGDNPQTEDSLILEFYRTRTNEWARVWGIEGDSLRNFRLVELWINDSNYLKEGFRFRFRNLATLSGSLDHWNLDYIRLGEKIVFSKNKLIDVSFIGESPSFIKNYTSMPWAHYLKDPEAFTVDSASIPIRNLGTQARVLQYQFSVHNYADTADIYSSPIFLDPSFDGKTDLIAKVAVNDLTPSFTFPDNGEKRGNFLIKNSLEVSPDVNQDNDTVFHVQSFDSYYAYDDGVAERAYSINGTGAILAYRFFAETADTLRGLLVNFPRMLSNELNRKINIMVWDDLSLPPIYESGPVWEVNYPDLNDFMRYTIDQDVGVSGEFYVGWQQQDSRKIYIGWDINNNVQDNIFYNRDGEWKNTSFEGALMIRPDFDRAEIIRASIEESELEESKSDFGAKQSSIFPNPTTGLLHIQTELPSHIMLHDLQGRLILQDQVIGELELELSQYPSGLYLLSIQNAQGQLERHKIALRK